METKEKTIKILNFIQSFAMVLVGSGIFSMGTTYFKEQSEYRIPRILLPIYEGLGNIGLAIGMIVLGGLIIYLGYKKFTSYNGKAIYILILALVCIIGFYGILYSTNRKMTYDDVRSSIEQEHKKTEDRIKNAQRPDIDVPIANAYLDQLEQLKNEIRSATSEGNKEKLDICKEKYQKIITKDFIEASKAMAREPKDRDFSLYSAKVRSEIDSYLKNN